jgi:hypothetical protein
MTVWPAVQWEEIHERCGGPRGQHPVTTSRSAPLGSTGGGIKSTLRAISGIEGFGVVAAMLGLCLFLTLTTDTFMTQNNLVSVLRQSSYIGIMAVGMVFVISMGDIDLSVGALLMFTSVTMSVMFREGYHPGFCWRPFAGWSTESSRSHCGFQQSSSHSAHSASTVASVCSCLEARLCPDTTKQFGFSASWARVSSVFG